MKKKIIVILVMMLLIVTTVIPVMGTINFDKKVGCYNTGILLDDDELDQSQTYVDSYNIWAVWSDQDLAQMFKPTKPILTSVQLLLTSSSTTLDIYVNIGTSSGTILGSDISRATSTGHQWVEFTFNDINVVPGQTYQIYLYLVNPGNNYCWCAHSSDNLYPYGCIWRYYHPSGDFTPYEDDDFCFKTYGKSNQADIIISDIKGGFGVSAVVFNNGDEQINMLGWEIDFEGFVPIGGKSDGSIDFLDPDESVTISTGFLLGIGPGWFRVSAGDVSVEQNCFIIGPFVKLRP
ncbi:MAG: hypothetical protein MUO82_03595 [Candidatus Thermoplasmatota archaeon]|nr:hypothetical protein [Candidatus Thermoplasmatota archaeon]